MATLNNLIYLNIFGTGVTLILNFVVGSLIVNIEGVLVHDTVRRNHDYTCTGASAV